MRRASFHLTQLTRRASLTSRTFLSANTSTDNFPRNKPLRAYSSSPPTNSSAPQTNPTKLSADKPSPEEQHAALLEAASQLPVPAYSFSTTPVNTGNPIPDALTDPHTNNIDIPAAPEALDMSTADADADDAYMAFLNKANEKPAPSAASTTSTQQQHGTFKPSDAAVPRALDAAALADRFYVSEADEPFEPVSYTWNGGARDLDIEAFKATVHPGQHARVEKLSVEEWDPRGEYGDVVKKVREAGGEGAPVTCFRVEVGRARVVYWVLSVGGQGKIVVGVRVTAVES